ncbi:MAG TPA: alpha/beta hydrolase family protein [Polyangia bacterium]|nr:alpha/beta hydrolase family protein [Polyangia bacterium]
MATFVLVHGAGTGGWLWRRVRSLLARAGHEVFTPTLTGLGERAHLARRDVGLGTHIDDIVGVLDYEELHDVILVGFSYAGMIIPAVADRLPGRVRRLIYLEAVVPQSGTAMLDVMPPEVREAWQRHVLAGDGWRVPPMTKTYLGRIDPDGADESEIRRLLARRTPQPLACFSEPLTLEHADALPPATFIHCTDKQQHDSLAKQAATLRARGWLVRELPTGHFCMLTMPGATASLLAEIAAAAQ